VPEKTVNFNVMKAIWLSTDISRAAELPEYAMMLDGTVQIKQKVAFQSFMRCGSSLSRKYMEQIFRVSTGSSYSRLLAIGPTILELQKGFQAEFYNNDDSIWCVKTHMPGVPLNNAPFDYCMATTCNRFVLDVLPSLFLLH